MTPFEFRTIIRSSSDKQCEFLDGCFADGAYFRAPKNSSNTVDIACLGGGAGFGGKSYTIRTGIIEGALRLSSAGVRSPRQIVLRKNATDLEESHIDVIKNGKDIHNETKEPNGMELFGDIRLTRTGYYEFAFHNKALGIVEFRHGQNLPRRRGAEYDFGWIDELTQFSREDYDAIKYMIRSSRNPPFLGVGCATNPDGIGNSWVKKWWVDRNFDDLTDEDLIDPDDFVFVPFTIHDNPANNESAIKMLKGQSELLRRSRYYGEWDLLSGTRFGIYNEGVHVFEWDMFQQFYNPDETAIEILNTKGLFNFYGSFDYGTAADSASAFHIHAVDVNRRVWTLSELYMSDTLLRDQAEQILDHIGPLKLRAIYCDPALRGMGDDVAGLSRLQLFYQNGINMIPSLNDRVEGWGQMEDYLYWKGKPHEEGYIPPKWRVHRNCTNLRKFLRNAPRDPHNQEDVAKNFKEDHAGDGPRYFFMGYFGSPAKNPAKRRAAQGGGIGITHGSTPIWINPTVA